MCLAYSAEVIALTPEVKCAHVSYNGVQTLVSVALLDDVVPGDHVLIHAGVALQKLDKEEAREYEELMKSVRQSMSEEI